jgi:MoaA/NifB/PqqE/SkfB family radical SAM enzyme
VGASLGRGFLRPENFRRLLDQGEGSLRSIELSNFGEPFLNPNLLEIFRIAYERGVALTINNGANLNNVRTEVLEGLIKYRVRLLRCSIDGTTQEIYAAYRRRGSLATVLGNIKKINELKAASGSGFPELIWQFVVFGHNQHQLAEARLAARILGMRFHAKLSWNDRFSPVTGVETLERQLGHAATRDRFLAETGEPYFGHVCHDLWKQPQINFDGRMLGCCVNYWGDYGGNVFDDLDAAINSPRMAYARAMLQGKVPPRDDVPCSRCDVYAVRRRLERWVVIEQEDAPSEAS